MRKLRHLFKSWLIVERVNNFKANLFFFLEGWGRGGGVKLSPQFHQAKFVTKSE